MGRILDDIEIACEKAGGVENVDAVALSKNLYDKLTEEYIHTFERDTPSKEDLSNFVGYPLLLIMSGQKDIGIYKKLSK